MIRFPAAARVMLVFFADMKSHIAGRIMLPRSEFIFALSVVLLWGMNKTVRNVSPVRQQKQNQNRYDQDVAIRFCDPPDEEDFLRPKLKPGWKAVLSSGGEVYYCNPELGTSQWDTPRANVGKHCSRPTEKNVDRPISIEAFGHFL